MARLLLDRPSQAPGLRFGDFARVLAAIVHHNEPRFAVGIFGSWGTGKTTLMEAVRRGLEPHCIPVDFNAWRYEREEHLIVPLLDTVREALVSWSGARKCKTAERAWKTAVAVGKIVASLAASLEAEVELPLLAKLSFKPSEAMKRAREFAQDEQEAEQAMRPKSLYHATFRALKEAFDDFFANDTRTRFVVFVDDLDRCLPQAALQVLESMKLFFDLQGFVFVVGLDRSVIELAVESRYQDVNQYAEKSGVPQRVRGDRYIEKIFQLSFALPPVDAAELGELLKAMLDEAKLEQVDRQLIEGRVLLHLEYLVRQREVNPREIKRYVNLFLLQRETMAGADEDTILALQTMAFRPDWRRVSDALSRWRETYRQVFQQELGGNREAARIFDEQLDPSPSLLLDYLRHGPAKALLQQPDLSRYIAVSRALVKTESTSSEAKLRDEALGQLMEAARRLNNLKVPLPASASADIESVVSAIGQAESLLRDFPPSAALTQARALLDTCRAALRSPPASSLRDAAEQQKHWVETVLANLRLATRLVADIR